jgi:hypothetical protein
MSDKLKLSGLSAVLINFSDQFGTIEKKTIQDAILLRDQGVSVLIICKEESFLEQEVFRNNFKKQNIFSVGFSFKNLITSYFELKKIISQSSFDVIHCYNYELLFSLCSLLKDKQQIPLLFTYNFLPHIQYKYIEKFFFSRLDSVFVLDDSLEMIAKQTLRVSPKKIIALGAGVNSFSFGTTKSISDSKFIIAAKISKGERETENLLVFLQAISSILQKSIETNNSIKVEFLLLTEGVWLEHQLYEKIKRIILERGLEYSVRFHFEPFGPQIFEKIHLLVSLDNNELLSSSEMLSYTLATPIVYPRDGFRSSGYEGKKIGESYKGHDARELREKVLKIMSNYSMYQKNLEEVAFSLKEEHGHDSYKKRLLSAYYRIFTQRHRFVFKRRRF